MSQRIAALPRQRERDRQRHITTSNSFARNRRTLKGGTLVGGSLVASRHRAFSRHVDRGRRWFQPPSFLILIVNEGSHAERWYRLYGERSKEGLHRVL